VLVNTPAPQGSTGITTNVFPAMTLGCGAMAGNITSDNVGPHHLMNIKRLSYVVRKPQEAFETPLDAPAPPKAGLTSAPASGLTEPIDRGTVVAAVERYLSGRRVPAPPTPEPKAAVPDSLVAQVTAQVLDRVLESRGACSLAPPRPAEPTAAAPPAPPAPPKAVEFVCEADVRAAMAQGRKIFIGPKTIVTPSARDLGGPSDILVLVRG